MKTAMTKMLLNFFLNYVVIGENNFAAGEEETILSESSILKTWTHMDLSGRGYKAIDNATFVGFTEIVSLNLANNKLTVLSEAVFSPLEKLTHLNLAGNSLKIAKNIFLGLDNLKTLDISENGLENLGSNFFAGLTSQCFIKITNDMYYMSIYGDAFGSESFAPQKITTGESSSAEPKHFKFSSDQTKFRFQTCTPNSTELIPWNGTDVLKKNCDLVFDLALISRIEKGWYDVNYNDAIAANISGIIIFGLRSDESMSDIFDGLPVYLKKVQVSKSLITRLTNGTLKHNSVVELSLASNEISVIESDAFDMPELKILSLYENQLRDIDSLKNLPTTIETLDLDRNEITTITDDIFGRLKKLKKLTLDENRITTIELGAFDNLDYLEELSLSDNMITDIKPGTFSMPKLKILNLSKNRLTAAASLKTLSPTVEKLNLLRNDITTIPANYFSSLTNLKTLDVSENRIHTIEPGAFENLNHLEELFLKGNVINDIAPGTFNMLNLKILKLNYNELHSVSSLVTLPPSLETLNLEFNRITELKSNCFSHLKNLKELDLSNNGINTIELGAFDDLPFLEKLSLRNNALTDIKADTFKMLNLKILELDSNQLHNVSSLATLPTSLETLHLEFNQITDIKSNCFSNLKNLKELNLNNNVIDTIELGAFKNLHNLETLNLEANRISDIKPGTFEGLTLKQLYLVMNKLHDITSLSPLPSTLETLNLSYNEITTITVGAFDNLHSLKELSLAGNHIRDINSGILEKLNIKILNLDGNQLHDINSLTTLPLTIEKLSLHSNKFTKITANIFSRFKNLTELVLERNEISTIDHDAFENLHKLEKLSLGKNNLTNIEPGLFETLNIKILNLDMNKLHDITSTLPLPSTLETLNLMENEITAITSSSFSRLKNLTRLVLHRNKITSIEIGAFEHLGLLTQLDISSNHIEGLEAGVFTGLRNLEELNLSYNRITRLNADTFDLPQLRALEMSMNKITVIEKGTFKNSRRLCALRLSSNPIVKLGNGELFGLRKKSSCRVDINAVKLEGIEGGVFDDA